MGMGRGCGDEIVHFISTISSPSPHLPFFSLQPDGQLEPRVAYTFCDECFSLMRYLTRIQPIDSG